MSLKLGQKVFLVASALVALLLVAIAVLAVLQRGAAQAAQWADHSRLVLTQTDDLSQTLVQAEDDQRAYLLTRHPSFLARYQSDVASIPAELSELERLVGDNPQQTSAARALAESAELRLRILDRTIARSRSEPTGSVRLNDDLQAGIAAMNDFQRQLRAFSNEELRLQDVREATFARSFELLDVFLGVCAILAVALTIIDIAFFNRRIIRRISDLGDKAVRLAEGSPLGPLDDAPSAGHAASDAVSDRSRHRGS